MRYILFLEKIEVNDAVTMIYPTQSFTLAGFKNFIMESLRKNLENKGGCYWDSVIECYIRFMETDQLVPPMFKYYDHSVYYSFAHTQNEPVDAAINSARIYIDDKMYTLDTMMQKFSDQCD